MAKLIRERILERIEGDKSMNPSVLSRLTVVPGEDIGIGEKTIQAILDNPGRVPEVKTLVALARALGDDHADYHEWPIAVARAGAKNTDAARKKREADALRKRAQRQAEHPSDAPDTKPARRRRKGQGP